MERGPGRPERRELYYRPHDPRETFEHYFNNGFYPLLGWVETLPEILVDGRELDAETARIISSSFGDLVAKLEQALVEIENHQGKPDYETYRNQIQEVYNRIAAIYYADIESKAARDTADLLKPANIIAALKVYEEHSGDTVPATT